MASYIPELKPKAAGPLPTSYGPSSVPSSWMFSPLDMGSGSDALSGLGSLASFAGPIGSVIGAGMNLIGASLENRRQEEFYNKYLTPQAYLYT